jgi:hypothetical protein
MSGKRLAYGDCGEEEGSCNEAEGQIMWPTSTARSGRVDLNDVCGYDVKRFQIGDGGVR